MGYKGLVVSALAVAVLAVAACGGGDDEVEVTGEPTSETVAASTTSVPASTPTVVTAPSPTPRAVSAVSPEPVSEVGTLRLLVSDQENAIGDFAQLIVSIETVSVSSDEGLIDLAVAPEDREVDLVQLQGDAAEEIIRAELAVGTYSKVFLRIGEVRGVLADGVTEAEVGIPSGSLQLNKPFKVAPGEVTTFVYDISVVSAGPGSGEVKYLIKPVIGESGSDQGFIEVESDKSRKPEPRGGPGSGDDKGKPTATPTPAPAPTATATPEPTSTPTPTATPDALGAEFFLDLISPLDGDIFDEPSVTVVGRTRIDAFVSVNDDLPEPDENGRFEATVVLEEGPNVIEIVASIADGEQLDIVILVIYIPES